MSALLGDRFESVVIEEYVNILIAGLPEPVFSISDLTGGQGPSGEPDCGIIIHEKGEGKCRV